MDTIKTGENGSESGGVNLRALEGGRSGQGGGLEDSRSIAATAQGSKSLLTFDSVNRPKHYATGGIECIDAIRAQLSPEEWRGFLRGQIAKYNWRMTKKGAESEDAKKLAFYASLLAGVDPRKR